MQGRCLCGAIEFELSGQIPNLYQCHCSLCRKVTGSSANAAIRIAAEQFEWLQGRDSIREYVTPTGFKSHFCDSCGSPVPNLTRHDKYYWVPVGLLEDSTGISLVAQLFVGSRAPWDVIAEVGQKFDEMPAADDLDRLLEPGKAVT